MVYMRTFGIYWWSMLPYIYSIHGSYGLFYDSDRGFKFGLPAHSSDFLFYVFFVGPFSVFILISLLRKASSFIIDTLASLMTMKITNMLGFHVFIIAASLLQMDTGTIYKKPLHLMVRKLMFPVDVPFHWAYVGKIWRPRPRPSYVKV